MDCRDIADIYYVNMQISKNSNQYRLYICQTWGVRRMLKIAVCDDEKYFRNEIKEMLSGYFNDNGIPFEIDTYGSGKDLVKLGVEMLKYRISFLDMNMNDLDGLETARHIRQNSKDVFIVFVTAFANYTLDGYKVDAIRYILKNNDSLQDSIYECMDAIQDKMNYKVIWKEFNFNEGYRKISLEQLLYVESRLHKLEFYVMEDTLEKYTLYEKLDVLETELANDSFIRIHQSFLVNMKYIKSINRYVAHLNNGIDLDIPKARYKYVEEMFVAYKGEI